VTVVCTKINLGWKGLKVSRNLILCGRSCLRVLGEISLADDILA